MDGCSHCLYSTQQPHQQLRQCSNLNCPISRLIRIDTPLERSMFLDTHHFLKMLKSWILPHSNNGREFQILGTDLKTVLVVQISGMNATIPLLRATVPLKNSIHDALVFIVYIYRPHAICCLDGLSCLLLFLFVWIK